MEKYRKFIVSAVGTTIAGLAAFVGIEINLDAALIGGVVVQVLTALGVWAVPNSQ